MDCFDKFRIANEILPMIQAHIDQNDTDMEDHLVQHAGEILQIGIELITRLQPKFLSSIIGLLKKYSLHSKEADRLIVAYNLPGIAILLGAEHFKLHLIDTLVVLSQDQSEIVRQKVAISIHEIAKVFADNEDIKSLEKIIFPLLKDESTLVLEGLFSNISLIP